MLKRTLLSAVLALGLLAEPRASLLFDDAVSDKLEAASTAIVTNEPITMAAWYFPDALDTTDTLISVGNSGSVGFWRIATAAADTAAAQKQNDSGSLGNAATSAVLTINTWHHVAGVFVSDTDRTVYLDGVNAVQDTTSITDSAANRTTIGHQAGNLGSPTPASGRIAEVGIWNAALTVPELAMLAKGYAPKLVRPQNLVLYTPLIRTGQDIKGLALTATGTAPADHPRVIYHKGPQR